MKSSKTWEVPFCFWCNGNLLHGNESYLSEKTFWDLCGSCTSLQLWKLDLDRFFAISIWDWWPDTEVLKYHSTHSIRLALRWPSIHCKKFLFESQVSHPRYVHKRTEDNHYSYKIMLSSGGEAHISRLHQCPAHYILQTLKVDCRTVVAMHIGTSTGQTVVHDPRPWPTWHMCTAGPVPHVY